MKKPQPKPTENTLPKQLADAQAERERIRKTIFHPEAEHNEIWEALYSSFNALGQKIETLKNRIGGGWKNKGREVYTVPAKQHRTPYN